MSRSPFAPSRTPLWLLLAGVLALGLLALPGEPARADHSGSHTMVGEYYWTGGNTGGDLKAVFTSTGDGTWDVEFFFDFRSKPHVYAGTAEGSVTEGELAGEVKNENRRRTFVFSGATEAAEGDSGGPVFKAEHFEITQGERRTGTLEMTLQ